jgi:hypothetical protein
MREKLAFRPVRANEFEESAAADRTEYVEDMVANGGMSRAEATAKAQRDQSGILVAGVATPGQALYFVIDPESGARVGRVWFAESSRQQFTCTPSGSTRQSAGVDTVGK